MNDCIFGIKCNGVSIQVSPISIDDDQSKFDYICNVSLKDSWNGNGTYDVSIINKDYVQGMPIGKWRITKAWISYNWGDSFARLKMEDEYGNETCDITADNQSGSARGFHVPSLQELSSLKHRKSLEIIQMQRYVLQLSSYTNLRKT